jgi:ferredoxin--NADP+ reductase
MSNYVTEQVLHVHHWSDRVFSFTTTRSPGFRFENGQFVMVGLQLEDRPLLRAYSIASANHEETLEFLSIKAPNGALTSRLQHLQPGHSVLVGRKPTGTLLIDDLRPGRHLYLLCSGTGLAPFMSIIKDPVTYERFEKVVLMHSVRFRAELAYRDFIEWDFVHHEFLGQQVRDHLLYFPTVTRQHFKTRERITDLLRSGSATRDLGLPELDSRTDRAMVCGSPEMLADVSRFLEERGFERSPSIGEPGDYVIERAFVAR